MWVNGGKKLVALPIYPPGVEFQNVPSFPHIRLPMLILAWKSWFRDTGAVEHGDNAVTVNSIKVDHNVQDAKLLFPAHSPEDAFMSRSIAASQPSNAEAGCTRKLSFHTLFHYGVSPEGKTAHVQVNCFGTAVP